MLDDFVQPAFVLLDEGLVIDPSDKKLWTHGDVSVEKEEEHEEAQQDDDDGKARNGSRRGGALLQQPADTIMGAAAHYYICESGRSDAVFSLPRPASSGAT